MGGEIRSRVRHGEDSSLESLAIRIAERVIDGHWTAVVLTDNQAQGRHRAGTGQAQGRHRAGTSKERHSYRRGVDVLLRSTSDAIPKRHVYDRSLK